MNRNENTDPTGLDCLAFHVLANQRRSTDHVTRRLAIHLANRWGGQGHCLVSVPRHRNERGSAGDVVAVLGSLVGIVVVGVILALAVIGKAQASEPTITLNNHRVVVASTLPSCGTEDSLSESPCTWNVNEGDGNGVGLAYYSKGDGVIHYIWASDPRGKGWEWVPGQARIWQMREYGLTLDVSCMWKDHGYSTTVKCANGNIIRWAS